MARNRRYRVDVASPGDVEEFAADLPAAFLECRELGHNWKPWTAINAGRYFERRLRCPRCRTEREETLSLRGQVLTRRMIYPDGYLAKNIGRIVGDGRDALRLESLTRFVSTPQNEKRSATAQLRVVS